MADSVAIFEDTKLKLSLKVSKGETPEKSLEFILLVDGEGRSNWAVSRSVLSEPVLLGLVTESMLPVAGE